MNTATAIATPAERFWLAFPADPYLHSHERTIRGLGLSREEAEREALVSDYGYADDEEPGTIRVEAERDDDGVEWHVVYGVRGDVIYRNREEHLAHEFADRAGYLVVECTERLYEAQLDNWGKVDWLWKPGILADIDDATD